MNYAALRWANLASFLRFGNLIELNMDLNMSGEVFMCFLTPKVLKGCGGGRHVEDIRDYRW